MKNCPTVLSPLKERNLLILSVSFLINPIHSMPSIHVFSFWNVNLSCHVHRDCLPFHLQLKADLHQETPSSIDHHFPSYLNSIQFSAYSYIYVHMELWSYSVNEGKILG